MTLYLRREATAHLVREDLEALEEPLWAYEVACRLLRPRFYRGACVILADQGRVVRCYGTEPATAERLVQRALAEEAKKTPPGGQADPGGASAATSTQYHETRQVSTL